MERCFIIISQMGLNCHLIGNDFVMSLIDRSILTNLNKDINYISCHMYIYPCHRATMLILQVNAIVAKKTPNLLTEKTYRYSLVFPLSQYKRQLSMVWKPLT